MQINLFSPAKINWTLDIFPKKNGEDFHQLDTIYQKISLGDYMTIVTSDKFKIIGNFSCNMEQNLIYKAFLILREFYPNLPYVKVTVEKNIPEKGGLGGGSSNAGTFVRGMLSPSPNPSQREGKSELSLVALLSVMKGGKTLLERLGELGKDVPFFCFEDNIMRGTKFGEELKKCDDLFLEKFRKNFRNKPFYIYRPNFENDTGEMYARLSETNLSQPLFAKERGHKVNSFTDNFLKNPCLENTGNGFDVFLQDKKYQEIFPDIFWKSNYGMCGSGSCIWNEKEFDIKGITKWKI